MSRKRYISTDISTDTKVAELAECGLLAPLLYTWAIPHMDDWGRITGNTREFKLLVCPGLDITNRDVDEAINQIVKNNLWIRYEVEGKKCIAVFNEENWFKHQSYISKDKRFDDSKSTFPKLPQFGRENIKIPQNAEEHRETPQNPSSFSFSLSSSVSVSDSSINIPFSESEETDLITIKETVASIFENWKSLNLVKHRSLSGQITNQVTWKLKEFTADELNHCIKTYSEVLNNPNYVLDTRWGLDEFLEKGHFQKFLPDRDPYSYYPKTAEFNKPPKKSNFQKNKELLMRGRGAAHDIRSSGVPAIQSGGELPER